MSNLTKAVKHFLEIPFFSHILGFYRLCPSPCKLTSLPTCGVHAIPSSHWHKYSYKKIRIYFKSKLLKFTKYPQNDVCLPNTNFVQVFQYAISKHKISYLCWIA